MHTVGTFIKTVNQESSLTDYTEERFDMRRKSGTETTAIN